MNLEIWKTKEINGVIYYISNFGNIKTNKNVIKTRKDKDGYLVFTAGKKNCRISVKIHRIVAELFIPNVDNHLEVNHKDFNRENPHDTNLEWCSHLDNVRYSRQHNAKVFNDNSADNNPNARLTRENVMIIKRLLNYQTVAEIARKFNVGWETINHIKRNETWKTI